MSQEARTVRPFISFGDIGALVEGAVLHFGDISCQPNTRVAFDSDTHTFAMRPVKIEWAPSEAELSERTEAALSAADVAGFSRSSLSLVVIASTPYLKAVDIVFSTPLSQITEIPRLMTLTEGGRSRAFDASHHGFTVEVFVLLNDGLDPQPLRPSRKGTWLARSRFTVVTDAAQTLFRLTPMDASKKESLGLGPRAIRYLELDDHDPLEPFEDQDRPEFFVDDQLLTQLHLAARTPSSKAMQLQLAVDFIAAVVSAGSKHPQIKKKSLEDIEDSLLHRVIRAAAGPGARESDFKVLYSRVSDDPGWVVAHAESTLDIRSGVMATLQGDGR